MKRRDFLRAAGTGAALASTVSCATLAGTAKPKVLVVGGGYGGATAAKYVRKWSEGAIDVTLVEPCPMFVSCPLSNTVLGGVRPLSDLTMPYGALVSKHGVRIVKDSVVALDAAKRTARLASGAIETWDRAIVSPGIDFIWEDLPGMLLPGAQEKVLHAWKAGPQTLALRAQLEAMPDGGVFVMTIPLLPFRCPAAPYERVCQVAYYFSRAKPRSKVLVLDANEDVATKGALFRRAWATRYRGMIEYRAGFATVDVDAAGRTAISELDERVSGDVLNVIPPQRAGAIALASGLANINKHWCEVQFLSFESTQATGVHVLGDAIQAAPLMPKSAHMANQHARVCAAAVVDLLQGRAPRAPATLGSSCYSFVSDKEAIHIASAHAWDAKAQTMLVLPGSATGSAAASEVEGADAMSWARNIWADTLL
jgi:sulfide dehydrogenase [flavocytochrome c] flavoprotein subunit